MQSEAKKSEGKFSTNWEGSIKIQSIVENETYKIEHFSSKTIPRTWNASYFKFYFSWM